LDYGGAPHDNSCTRPAHPGVIDRRRFQPRELVGSFIIAWAADVAAAASAASVPDLFGRLEESGLLKRVDAAIEPTMNRMAILSDIELGQLRKIENVIRAGRVRRIQTDRIL